MQSTLLIKLILVGLLTVILSSCGGGNNSKEEHHLINNSVTFNQVGPFTKFTGETFTNTATGLGSGLLTYSSSNNDIANVDNTGRVTFVNAGNVIITASKAADDQYLGASANYTVNVTGTISFTMPGPLYMWAGESFTNQAIGLGNGAITYASSDTTISTVNENGQVTLNGAGDIKITATKEADSQYPAAFTSYIVHSQLRNRIVSFDRDEIFTRMPGDTLNNPAEAQGSDPLIYSSSDTSIATVDSTGLVTIHSVGDVTITASKAATPLYVAASKNYLIRVAPLNRFIVFNEPGPLNMHVGQTLVNQASAPGTAPIIYTSSDTSIATVDNTGLVTLIQTGSVTITASKVADAQYVAASANYIINSQHTDFGITAWIGNQNTLVDFSTAPTSMEFYRSNSSNCDITNYLNCANGQFNLLNGSTITDTSATLNREAYYILKSGIQKANLVLSGNILFSPRVNHQIVSFQNKFWLIGGQDDNGYTNDIWSSNDAKTWHLKSPNAGFPARARHQVVVFNNKLWLTGGTGLSDIWSSTNGVDWIQHTASAPFSAREGHQVVAFNNKLWLIGGFDNTNNLQMNDVWSSTDGANWIREIAEAEFPKTSTHKVVVFNNTMWLINGETKNIWSSNNGIDWTQRANNISFPSKGYQVAIDSERLWVIGGELDSNLSQARMWSTDGINWNNQNLTSYLFPATEDHQVISYNHKLWVIGGKTTKIYQQQAINTTNLYTNNIWSSGDDGLNWTQEAQVKRFQPRNSHQVVSFKNKLWLIGGQAFSTYQDSANDIWSSDDGVLWTQRTANAAFAPRYGHQVTVFNNKLWLTGGISSTAFFNDVWSSDDGINWTLEKENAFSPRFNHQAIVFNNKLWVIAGEATITKQDIWSSPDGINWTQEIAQASFSYRSATKVIAFNNKLWLIGDTNKSDIWSSNDGVSWTKEIDNAAFGYRGFTQVVSYNNKLWLIGGTAINSNTNDVWSSNDAINWIQETAHAAFSNRSGHQVVNYNGLLTLIGGDDGSPNGKSNDVWSSSDGINWRKGVFATFDFSEQ